MNATEAAILASKPMSETLADRYYEQCKEGIKQMAATGCYTLKIYLLAGYEKRESSTAACNKVISRLKDEGYKVSAPELIANDHLQRSAITIDWNP